MILVDTSVWIAIFRDRTGQARNQLQVIAGSQPLVLTRFTQLELLQGCRDQHEWNLLSNHLLSQTYLELRTESWLTAARIYYELRRQGLTVRSPIDCCIAQVSLDYQVPLIHNDRDFITIAGVRPLQHTQFLLAT